MKISIKHKLFAAICGIAVAFVGIMMILNLFCYKEYYLYERRHALVGLYQEINSQYAGSIADITSTLEQMENRTAVRLSIIDTAGQMTYDSFYREHREDVNDDGWKQKMIEPDEKDLMIANAVLANVDEDELQLKGYTVLLSRLNLLDEFDLAPDDAHMNEPMEEFLCLVAKLEATGELLIMRLPMAYMEQNTSFNSTFLLIAGLATLLLCMGMAYLLSRHFVKPLIEIEEVATAMADLNFKKNYTGGANDEIGRLGQSINRLSEHLATAISELQQTNEELAHEIEEKERIDSMRREFIVNVSHELKTPIALIQGYAEGLRVGVMDNQDDRDYYCSIIVDEAHRMNHLVMQLLGLSKLELGNDLPEPTEVELHGLCMMVVQKLSVLQEERQQTISCEQCSGVFYADYEMMEQVVTNYLSNAIRYTPFGGKINLFTREQADGAMCLCVDNEGEAIAPEELMLIFEKFYRTDKARSRESGGTGIGLSIVRAIAEAHHGTCGAENIENGVRFWFCLPPKASQDET